MRLRTIESYEVVHKKIINGAKDWPQLVDYMSYWGNIFHIPNSRFTVCPRHPATRGSNCLVDIEEASLVSDQIFEGREKARGAIEQVDIALEAEEAAQKVFI